MCRLPPEGFWHPETAAWPQLCVFLGLCHLPVVPYCVRIHIKGVRGRLNSRFCCGRWALIGRLSTHHCGRWQSKDPRPCASWTVSSSDAKPHRGGLITLYCAVLYYVLYLRTNSQHHCVAATLWQKEPGFGRDLDRQKSNNFTCSTNTQEPSALCCASYATTREKMLSGYISFL